MLFQLLDHQSRRTEEMAISPCLVQKRASKRVKVVRQGLGYSAAAHKSHNYRATALSRAKKIIY